MIEFEQKQKRLLAHGEGLGAPGTVHTVLVRREWPGVGSAASSGAGKPEQWHKAGTAKSDGPEWEDERGSGRSAGSWCIRMRHGRRTLRAGFRWRVWMEVCGGSRRWCICRRLRPSGVKKVDVAVGGGLMGGNVERVVASGHIEMLQPGRRATGEQLGLYRQ